ncbi:MAG: alpha/beta fold hydrolase [Bacteroidota bacterium]
MQKLKRAGLILLSLFLLVILMFHTLQDKLIFLPSQLPLDYTYTFDHQFEEIFLDTPDGARLNALHFKSKESNGLILYFHGNAGDLSRWGLIATDFVDLGYDVLIMDYRGYGKSNGEEERSEEILLADAQLFYDLARQDYQEADIILYGRSLGSGIATYLASRNNPRKLLLETPYYSLVDVAKGRFPFLPVKQIMKYQLNSFDFMKKVKAPIRIFHGTQDKIVPYASGKKLFASISNPDKMMYTIPEGEHNNLIDFESFRTAVKSELD